MRPVILDTYHNLDNLDIAGIGDAVCSVLFLQGPQTHNKEAFNEWDVAKGAAMEILPKVAYVMAFSGWTLIYFWVIPKLKHFKDMLDASNKEKLAMVDEIERCHQRLRQFEARDSVGQGKRY
ncbi:uncharacterized protein LOC120712981 isoform X1 [Panicum virgatum]|uniref:Uncharacterized protein n=1 Tax=Panicum virgatum TaxID=38727 RepID=A0A8T0RGY1_PANVG|nr:uncharacterized protein LOC120712981 isoform X1 [Panicum virgatum]KAG2585251.1 hypothetical protein PVAP13_6KG380900 [Panicum virgatum]